MRFLICTDVAARGIDITGVPYGKSSLRTRFYLSINMGATVKYLLNCPCSDNTGSLCTI